MSSSTMCKMSVIDELSSLRKRSTASSNIFNSNFSNQDLSAEKNPRSMPSLCLVFFNHNFIFFQCLLHMATIVALWLHSQKSLLKATLLPGMPALQHQIRYQVSIVYKAICYLLFICLLAGKKIVGFAAI